MQKTWNSQQCCHHWIKIYELDYFYDNGDIKPSATSYFIDEVEEGVEYAMLISTNAGAWRYLIGDTVKFVDKFNSEVIITGRTKHFLSLCGEHLSVDNMNTAIQKASIELGVAIKEFTVTGKPDGNLFSHHWYVGTDDIVDADQLRITIDTHLHELNDDYAVERKHALKNVHLDVLPSEVFYDWMKSEGKFGGQTKFPRVLKKEKLNSWLSFLGQMA